MAQMATRRTTDRSSRTCDILACSACGGSEGRKRKGRKEDKREKYKNRKIEVKSFGEVIEAAETY